MKKILCLLFLFTGIAQAQWTTPNLTGLDITLTDIILTPTTRITLNPNGAGNVVVGNSDNNDTLDIRGVLKINGVQQTSSFAATYAAIGFADSSVAIAASQNTWYHVANTDKGLFTSGVSANVTIGSDSLIVLNAGDYEIMWDLSYSGNNTDVYEIAIFKNAVEQQFGQTIRGMSGTDSGVSASSTILTLAANDGIKLQIKNTANNGDPTLRAGNIVIQRVK